MNPAKPIPELSVVIPCLNEAETIGACVQAAQQAFAGLRIAGEVVVCDNGSGDDSAAIARQNGARVVQQPMRGYGHALRRGIEAARGKFILIGDADQSYDFGEMGRFVEKLRQGYDLVMGCSLPAGGGEILPGAMPWLHRWIGNPVLSKIGRVFFKSPVTDFHCGMRALTKSAYSRMGLNTGGMEFASEMVIKATLMGMRITEVPVTLHPDGRSRPPHLRRWRDGWYHLRFMLLYSPRWLFLYPAVFLLFFGLLLMLWLLPGPRVIHGIRFDTNTLIVGAMSVILGVQMFAFAVAARVFAVREGFLPEDALLTKIRRFLKLETGIALGAGLVLVGIAAIVAVLIWWSRVQFGNLPRAMALRVMVPAITSVVCGVQILFSSFFISFLTLKRR